MGLCGSSRDIQRRVAPLHALGMGLTEARVEAAPAAPGAAVPDAAAGASAVAPDAAGLADGPGTRAAVLVEVAADVVDANARPDPSAAATVSVTAAGAGVPVIAASFIAATEAGVPAPVVAAEAGTPTSAAAATFVAAPWADVPASAAAAAFVAATGAGVLASPTAAVPVVAAGADSLSSVATAIPVMVVGATASVSGTAVGAACSSSASSSRSITTPVGGPLGAMPCPAGSAEEVEGGTGVRPCPVPGCGTTPPVAATGATSAVGSAVSLVTPPLAADRVAVRPAEVEDTRSAFFGASDGTKSRGGGTMKQQKRTSAKMARCQERNKTREEFPLTLPQHEGGACALPPSLMPTSGHPATAACRYSSAPGPQAEGRGSAPSIPEARSAPTPGARPQSFAGLSLGQVAHSLRPPRPFGSAAPG
ncbi:ice-structuring glycoprotein-like [Setaria italica]|uniref:ice-structuring glycoprotein-like n=1 Tax=Setaria italica TaxID=4555 RepID=UPI000350B76A|nr:ice-structuring glycoprotein-like [Setaria italica]